MKIKITYPGGRQELGEFRYFKWLFEERKRAGYICEHHNIRSFLEWSGIKLEVFK